MRTRASDRRRRISPMILILAGLGAAVVLAAVAVLALNGPVWPPRKWTPPLPAGFAGDMPFAWKQLSHRGKAVARFEDGGLTVIPQTMVRNAIYNGVTSTFEFDFTGQARGLRVDLQRLNFNPGIEAKFRITADHAADYASLERSETGELYFVQKAGGQLKQSFKPYDPVADAWFRIRHEPKDDSFRWETSPDGKTWTERHKDGRGFDIQKVRIELYAGSFRPVPNPGLVRFTDCCRPGG